MLLRNGSRYKPAQGLEVVDNNIVRHVGMHRLPSKNKTPFQGLLDTITQNHYQLSEQQYAEIISKVLAIPALNNKAQMFSASDVDIMDANNDNARRYFETVLAKKILNHFLMDMEPKLGPFITKFKAFLIDQYNKAGSDFVSKWQAAQNGEVPKKDENLAHYVLLRKNLIVLLNDNHFSSHSFLLELFDLHYLTHPLASLPEYKIHHPAGYIKCYSENSQYYTNANRGRITGYGFNHNEPSYNLGIMRSIDKTPHDLRRPMLISSETRCPDRLYMSHPKVARSSPSNWLNQAFSNPYNSIFVNGLSGSILLEINAALFFIKMINLKSEPYTCKDMDPEEIKQNNFKLLKNYFLTISSLFIYFEGGHTFTEIMSVFNLDNVNSSIQTVLGASKGSFSLKTLMLDDPKIYSLIQESLIDAAKYQERLDQIDKIHQELIRNKKDKIFKSIQAILCDFEGKISTIGTHSHQAKIEAIKLLKRLNNHLNSTFMNPLTSKSLDNFKNKVEQEINKSLPALQRDLNWKDYLLNIVNKIARILINLFTLNSSNVNGFFAHNTSQAERTTNEMNQKIQAIL